MFYPARRTRRHAQPRRGYALVLFVVFMMIFVSIAGLVIGLGFVRLSQQQMRSATDAAALEGLRWRDEIPEELAATVQGCGPADVDDEMWRDCARRYLAGHMAERVLSDPAGESTTLGAGPVFALEDGVPLGDDFQASETLSLPDQRSYVPQLQPNLSDQPHGDMVAGTYRIDSTFTGTQDETGEYQRRDFDADGGNDAFLVRMRRTRGGDLDNSAGVSSRGPEVPMLFGRWMTFKSGVTVRSTSIAAVGPFSGTAQVAGLAKSVGPYHVNPETNTEIAGLAPFGIGWSFWQDTTARWSDGVTALSVADADAGDLVFFDADRLLVVGTTVPNDADDTVLGPVDEELATYVPVYDNAQVIVGFARVEWEYDGSTLTLTRPWEDDDPIGYIGSGNVSGVPASLVTTPQSSITDEQLVQFGPLYTPVLVNRHLGPN